MKKPVRVYQRKDSQWWWASIYIEGKRQQISFREDNLSTLEYTKEEAQEFVLDKFGLHGYLERDNPVPGLETLGWMHREILRRTKREGLREKSIKEYRFALNHLVELLGAEFNIHRIQKQHVGQLQDFLISKDITAPTINKHCSTIKAAFNRLVDDEIIERNPFRKFTRLREVVKGPKNLSREQSLHLLDVIEKNAPNENAKHLLRISLYTGLRRQEVLAIRRDEIDMKNRRMRVMNIKREDYRKRWIFIPQVIAGDIEYFLGANDKPEPLRVCAPDTYSKWAKTVIRAAGLPESIKLHSLRHTFITLAGTDGGVELWRIQQHVDHASQRTTEGYFSPDADRMGIISIGIEEEDRGKNNGDHKGCQNGKT